MPVERSSQLSADFCPRVPIPLDIPARSPKIVWYPGSQETHGAMTEVRSLATPVLALLVDLTTSSPETVPQRGACIFVPILRT